MSETNQDDQMEDQMEEQRTVKLTVRALAHKIETLQKDRHSFVKQIKGVTKEMKALMENDEMQRMFKSNWRN